MNIQISESAVAHGNHDDAEYEAFLARVQARFMANIDGGFVPLFQTDARDLWGTYLGSFTDPAERQHHNCHACRKFIERFGSLVTIDGAGMATSAIWHEDDAPAAYKPAIAAMAKEVRRARVMWPFVSSDKVWGTPQTGPWRHLAVVPLADMLHKGFTQTESQVMAEKREDFNTVMRALEEFKLPHLETALQLLRSDSLYRAEKVLGQAEWLHGLHVARAGSHGTGKANVVWRAVASAPAGFCHPRSSMIGTLLEDIAAGKCFENVSSAFKAKMSPLQYQRPQAAPTAGAIAAAEKVMAQLGAAGSLARRFARLDEVKALWRPAPAKPDAPAGGVFGHLKPKGAEPAPSSMRIPAQTMTWNKFRCIVLPNAERMEMMVPNIGNFTALVTAVNADAPPILQCDHEDARNPVSSYVWVHGSSARQFGLDGGEFVGVDAITLEPSMWGGCNEHHGAGVIFVLSGARETRMAGAALFPEIMKAEFHGIRSVIEAYSKGASIEGLKEPHAAGLMLSKSSASWNATARVWSAGSILSYVLDRWD